MKNEKDDKSLCLEFLENLATLIEDVDSVNGSGFQDVVESFQVFADVLSESDFSRQFDLDDEKRACLKRQIECAGAINSGQPVVALRWINSPEVRSFYSEVVRSNEGTLGVFRRIREALSELRDGDFTLCGEGEPEPDKQADETASEQSENTLASVFLKASKNYSQWVRSLENKKTFPADAHFFSRRLHGRDGIARVERLVERLNSPIEQAPLDAIADYFHDNLRDENGKVMSGKTRDHNHSFISYLLNELKNEPALAKQLDLEGLEKVDYKDPENKTLRCDALKQIQNALQSGVNNRIPPRASSS
ncbi:MAG: hypothetical protein HY939_07865 [Gammaproteobacteria bacterium]|nr:hypothetical protein [Gammaproteobacteria bacterium]